MIVASPLVTSFFGTGFIAGILGLGIEPPLLLLVLRDFGPGDYHLSGAHFLSEVQPS